MEDKIYHNLVGRVENMSINGSLISDFTLNRPSQVEQSNPYINTDSATITHKTGPPCWKTNLVSVNMSVKACMIYFPNFLSPFTTVSPSFSVVWIMP